MISIKTRLRNQLLLVTFIAGGLSAFSLLVFTYVDRRRELARSKADLEASALSQADRLLPTLLLPEQAPAREPILREILEKERLSRVEILAPEERGRLGLSDCRPSQRIDFCRDAARDELIALIPIVAGNSAHGYLVKARRATFSIARNRDFIILISIVGMTAGVFLALLLLFSRAGYQELSRSLAMLGNWFERAVRQEAGHDASQLKYSELREIADQIRFFLERYRQLEKEVVHAEISRQVAHDIRSPLAALDSVMENIADLREDKRIIVRSAVGRIHDIANNLIREYRGPGAADIGRSAPCLLSNLIESLVTEKRLQFRSKIGVEIEGRLEHGSYGLFAEVEPAQFKRCLSNLVNNAVEALPGKGLVRVRLGEKDRNVLVTIQDDGKGIPAEVLARLGQKGETYDKPDGSGLGIPHAKTSVESWGGGLEIASQVGAGTTVTLRLPRARPPDWFVSRLELEPAGAVVVLDDDASIHQVWQGRFDSIRTKDHGIEILHFSTPAELRSWTRENPDKRQGALYLMDYELLGFAETGLDLARELAVGERTILVTSRFEEKAILEACLRLMVRMIPKGLAGFVPMEIAAPKEPATVVLLDDDALVHMNWRLTAKSKGIELMAFKAPQELLDALGGIRKDTPIYVDSHLAENIRGEAFAEELHRRGFTSLYLATGHAPESFPSMPWIKEIVGKEAPWE